MEVENLNKDRNVLQINISSLEAQYKELETRFNLLRETTSKLPKTILDPNASTSKGCSKCYNHDMNVCATNLAKIGVLEKKVKQYTQIMKE